MKRSMWQGTKSQQGPEALSLTTCKNLNPAKTHANLKMDLSQVQPQMRPPPWLTM